MGMKEYLLWSFSKAGDAVIALAIFLSITAGIAGILFALGQFIAGSQLLLFLSQVLFAFSLSFSLVSSILYMHGVKLRMQLKKKLRKSVEVFFLLLLGFFMFSLTFILEKLPALAGFLSYLVLILAEGYLLASLPNIICDKKLPRFWHAELVFWLLFITLHLSLNYPILAVLIPFTFSAYVNLPKIDKFL